MRPENTYKFLGVDCHNTHINHWPYNIHKFKNENSSLEKEGKASKWHRCTAECVALKSCCTIQCLGCKFQFTTQVWLKRYVMFWSLFQFKCELWRWNLLSLIECLEIRVKVVTRQVLIYICTPETIHLQAATLKEGFMFSLYILTAS